MSEYFCLRWNNYQSSLSTAFKSLQEEENFCDVTVTSEGKSMKAHKVILSACSTYFKQLLKNINQWQHPVLVFNHIPFEDLRSILNFVYQGQVNIVQDNLQSFLKTAEVFRIKGLTEESCMATNISDKSAGEREMEPTSVNIFPPEDKKALFKRPKSSSTNATHQPVKDPLSGGAENKRAKLSEKPEILVNPEPEERGRHVRQEEPEERGRHVRQEDVKLEPRARHVRQEDVKQEPLEAGPRDEIGAQYEDAGPLNNEHLAVPEDTTNLLVKSGTDLETVNCVVCRATLSNSNALYYHMNYVHSSGVQPMDFMRKMTQSEDIVKQEGD